MMLGFAACDDKSDLGVEQTNPQETVMSAEGVTVDFGTALAGTALDLNDYKDKPIPVIRLVEAKDLPEGATVSFTMELAANPDFTNAVTLDAPDGSVNTQEWDNFFRAQLGRSPKAKTNYVRFAAYINQDSGINGKIQRVRVGGEDTWFATKEISVTPIPLDFTIEQKYYLIGTINDWALNADHPFSHSSADVYDDPEFSIIVTVTEEQAAGGWWWKVASPSAVENGDWGAPIYGPVTDGDTALEGKITDKKPGAGCINKAGTYMMTVNMEDLTYKFTALSYLYTPGDANGWDVATSSRLQYSDILNCYYGYACLKGGFKFTSQADWKGTNYGFASDGKLSTDGGAGNITVENEGLYYITVNTTELTYTLVKVENFDIMGGFNDWKTGVMMTPTANPLIWKAQINLAAGDEFKFRANQNWDINLGGALNNLGPNGPNCSAPAAATAVTLDLSKVPYSCSVE